MYEKEGDDLKEMLSSAWDVLLRFTGAAGGIFGGGSLPVLLIVMGFNFITDVIGILTGEKAKNDVVKASVLSIIKKLTQKCTALGIIVLAGWLDNISGKNEIMKNAAIGFYICDEGISILKKAAVLGVPVPAVLKKALSAIEKE